MLLWNPFRGQPGPVGAPGSRFASVTFGKEPRIMNELPVAAAVCGSVGKLVLEKSVLESAVLLSVNSGTASWKYLLSSVASAGDSDSKLLAGSSRTLGA